MMVRTVRSERQLFSCPWAVWDCRWEGIFCATCQIVTFEVPFAPPSNAEFGNV